MSRKKTKKVVDVLPMEIDSSSSDEYTRPVKKQSIVIKKMPKEAIQNLGINIPKLKEIMNKICGNIEITDEAVIALAYALNVRMFSLIRASYEKKEFRLRENPYFISSVPKVHFAVLAAEQNAAVGIPKSNEICDDETKQFVNCLIEGRTFKTKERSARGTIRRSFPKNINELVPKTEKSLYVSAYDVFAALDDDKYIAQKELKQLYSPNLFMKKEEADKKQFTYGWGE